MHARAPIGNAGPRQGSQPRIRLLGSQGPVSSEAASLPRGLQPGDRWARVWRVPSEQSWEERQYVSAVTAGMAGMASASYVSGLNGNRF